MTPKPKEFVPKITHEPGGEYAVTFESRIAPDDVNVYKEHRAVCSCGYAGVWQRSEGHAHRSLHIMHARHQPST